MFVVSVQVKHTGMRYIFKSNFWLSMLLSSHIVRHCKQFPKTIVVCYNLSVKIPTMKLIDFSHCLPCIVISKNILLICLRSKKGIITTNEIELSTPLSSNIIIVNLSFVVHFVFLSSYNQSRRHLID